MTTRGAFLGAGTATLAAASALAGTPATAFAASGPSPFDFPAIAAALARPATHRQVIGTAKVADGDVLHYALNTLNAYDFDYGEPGVTHVAAVCYGSGVALLVDDAAWAKYKIASILQRRGDAVSRPGSATANPFLAATSSLDPHDAPSAPHGFYHDGSLTALAKRGASFFACNNALTGLANAIALTYSISSDPVEVVLADLRRHLVPGALLVPAGVAAVNQAQEAKFTLFLVTA
ncbi:MAG TPA: hypothetical protein VMD91_15250 [Candidatus Sulfotelmatobacter sp.]|nr:hypothetical protein [Candidatus Sulfotelmatobacter sp.]